MGEVCSTLRIAANGAEPTHTLRIAANSAEPTHIRRSRHPAELCATLPRTAWVSKDNYSAYSSGTVITGETETAWVFPDGLAVGKQVHYFQKTHEKRVEESTPIWGNGIGFTDTITLAMGRVAEISGNAVSFSWAGAVSQENMRRWTKSENPSGSLRTDESATEKGAASQRDEYQIQVPEEAWALLPQSAFLVTLTTRDVAEDGQLRVKVATIGGDEMEFHLQERSTVEALALLVARERQLGPAVAVKVVGPEGVVLDPGSVLCAPTSRTA